MNSYSSPNVNKLGVGIIESPILKVKITPVSCISYFIPFDYSVLTFDDYITWFDNNLTEWFRSTSKIYIT